MMLEVCWAQHRAPVTSPRAGLDTSALCILVAESPRRTQALAATMLSLHREEREQDQLQCWVWFPHCLHRTVCLCMPHCGTGERALSFPGREQNSRVGHTMCMLEAETKKHSLSLKEGKIFPAQGGKPGTGCMDSLSLGKKYSRPKAHPYAAD